jgi:hypothetical protein
MTPICVELPAGFSKIPLLHPLTGHEHGCDALRQA